MPVLGLTGGIASGKSSVAAFLRRKGAIVIDADTIARELVDPGTPALAEIAARFGPEFLRDDGTLDRARLGELVFSDPAALRELNALLHPRIFAEIRERLAGTDPDAVRIVEAALLVESAPWETGELALDGLIVVKSPREEQVRRLGAQRRMTEPEAAKRIDAQISADERLAAADYVVDNSGSLEDLEVQVDELWNKVIARFADDPGSVTPGY